MKRKKKKGFTLIEMIAVIAILGIFSTLMFSLFSSSTSMLVMAENDNILQNESRGIIDTLEDDIRYGTDISITNGVRLSLTRNSERYIYKVENGEFRKYKDNTSNNNIDNADIFIVAPSKNIDEFKISKEDNLYKIKFKFKKDKSNYEYENSIYPMNS